jgi:hypothetical protein
MSKPFGAWVDVDGIVAGNARRNSAVELITLREQVESTFRPLFALYDHPLRPDGDPQDS